MKEIRQLTKKEQAIRQYNLILERVIAGELDIKWHLEIAAQYNEDTPEHGNAKQEYQKSKTQLARQKIALRIMDDMVKKYEEEEKNVAEKV